MKHAHSNTIAVQLTDVTKTYTIHHEKPTLVEKFIKGKDETFIALNKINLTIMKGESIGIIGANGSGKTTLLKIIAGITSPTNGLIFTSGKIVSIIDLEAGFHPDLTGFQNIYISSLLLGMKKIEITNCIHKIIAFADINQFIDAPLYTYSNGMKLRLGFSIATMVKPDILIMDENIHTGDANFQKKIAHFLHKRKINNNTLVVVSHDMDIIKKYCKKIYQLHHGVLYSA